MCQELGGEADSVNPQDRVRRRSLFPPQAACTSVDPCNFMQIIVEKRRKAEKNLV